MVPHFGLYIFIASTGGKKRTNENYPFNGKFYFNLVLWLDFDFS